MTGREIPLSKKLNVVKFYFEGLSYDEIAKKTGVAKGSVTAIVDDLRNGVFPEFEHLAEMANELRDLAVIFRKAGVTPSQASLLSILTKKIIALGVEPSLLEAWVRMCQSVPPSEFSKGILINTAARLVRAEQKYGLGYEETLSKFDSLSSTARDIEAKLEALRVEKGQLEEISKQFTPSLFDYARVRE